MHHLIRERHQSASSVNIAVNAVRFLYGVTFQRDVEALMAGMPRMKRNTRRAEVYARSEIEAILSAPAQPRDRAFLMTVYAGGLRLSEATQLQIKDVDRASHAVARPQRQRRQGEGSTLEPALAPGVGSLLASSTPRADPARTVPGSFWADRAGQPMNRSTGQNIYYRAVRKSGVRRKGGIHLLRHSFATQLIESGVDLTLVQRLLGHASLLTTIRYLHVTSARLEAAQSPLDLIDLSRLGPPSRN